MQKSIPAVFLFVTLVLAPVGSSHPTTESGINVVKFRQVNDLSDMGFVSVDGNSSQGEINLLENWAGKVAVVTGASAGIGEGIVRYLVRSGLTVVGLARRRAKLEEIKQSLADAKGKFYYVETDVSQENEVEKAFLWIRNNLGRVHALVNNVKAAVVGTILEVDNDALRTTFRTNVMGLIYCTKETVAIMREKKIEGTIININDVLGHRIYNMPTIPLNVYPASKYAVTALTEIFQNEMENAGLNIRVTSLSPDLTKTSFGISSGILTHDKVGLPYPNLEPKNIAHAVAYILSLPQTVQVNEMTITPLQKFS